MLHPIILSCINRIQSDIIESHNVPMKLFETGRTHDRQQTLIHKGKTKDILSRHTYNLENDPPLYTTAVDYVFYNGRWSWNLRDSTVSLWYQLFGHMVLDICPELEWGGERRKAVNYCHFQLRESALLGELDRYPCVLP